MKVNEVREKVGGKIQEILSGTKGGRRERKAKGKHREKMELKGNDRKGENKREKVNRKKLLQINREKHFILSYNAFTCVRVL